ncbi:hypothetical protein [Chelatococcus asaccharovorans]|uniref:Uncharacterized protein n=1 Tax=Chelatococcus asaccharovorans TaxID=28210 RepID=A0A2V3UV36_9HYPH|nr:hypothetical protein [Chelatococcus asaccharovorans]MBS7701695.1 hypothetical protein [Chelatococcus asaccharovorans]PXW64598.1 hypothetical protein C7450_101357 [Chelatococcus asaccharovorans]
MSGQHSRARKGRQRRPVPHTLPDDLYDYGGGEPAPLSASRRRDPSPGRFDIERLPVIDDWPERVPVTEAEIDIFERYFGEVLDRLFSPNEADSTNGALRKLTSDVNSTP